MMTRKKIIKNSNDLANAAPKTVAAANRPRRTWSRSCCKFCGMTITDQQLQLYSKYYNFIDSLCVSGYIFKTADQRTDHESTCEGQKAANVLISLDEKAAFLCKVCALHTQFPMPIIIENKILSGVQSTIQISKRLEET